METQTAGLCEAFITATSRDSDMPPGMVKSTHRRSEIKRFVYHVRKRLPKFSKILINYQKISQQVVV